MKKFFVIAFAAMLCAFAAGAQIVTTSPELLQESSENVVLTFHADSPMGNNGLKGVTASTAVYAHVGAITNKSNGAWKFAPEWLDNSAKYKLTYVSANTWNLTIGDMRTYFGMTDAAEHVEKIALVFRDATGSKEGKTAAGGDILVNVAPEGYQMQLKHNASSLIIKSTTTITFTAVVSEASNITMTVNGTQFGSVSNSDRLVASHKFSAYGNYDIVATSTAGGKTISQKLTVVYPAPSEAGTYPGGVPKMGAVRNSDGTVTFCLAAPQKTSAVLVPSWDNYEILGKNSMKYQDYQGQRYFFVTVSGLDNTSYYPYYYLVDGTYKVGDPYARLVLDPYSDKWLENTWPGMPEYPYDKFDDVMLAVYKGNFDTDFNFDSFTIPDKENLIIYEMLIRDWNGTEGKANGEGTINMARSRIGYLKNMGVNAVEVMPVMEFNGNNSWGYNTNFYMALDKAYGSPQQFKSFVNECHQQGIAVILDIVLNHSDGLHPWYQMYPISSNPFYNQTAPHDYGVLNDWKQENPLVQQQWKDVLQFWLKVYNVDGFRFDLVKGLGTSYPSGTEAKNDSRIAVMKRLHANMMEVKADAIHINENLAGNTEENEMAADGQLNWNNQSNNSISFANGNASSADLSYYDSEKCSRTAFSTVSYAESHDEQRMGYAQNTSGVSAVKGKKEVSMKRLGQVAVQLLMTPGPKMIWQFGEFGADENTKNSSGNNTDPKKVIWSYAEDADRAALASTYNAMCNLRTDNPELFTSGATFETTGFGNNLTTMRQMRVAYGNKEVVAVINPLTSTASRNIPVSLAKTISKTNYQVINASKGQENISFLSSSTLAVSLPGNSYVVFATSNVAGVDDIVADDTADVDAPVEYFNLQGVPVSSDNLAPGLYIKRQGRNTEKVLIH